MSVHNEWLQHGILFVLITVYYKSVHSGFLFNFFLFSVGVKGVWAYTGNSPVDILVHFQQYRLYSYIFTLKIKNCFKHIDFVAHNKWGLSNSKSSIASSLIGRLWWLFIILPICFVFALVLYKGSLYVSQSLFPFNNPVSSIWIMWLCKVRIYIFQCSQKKDSLTFCVIMSFIQAINIFDPYGSKCL